MSPAMLTPPSLAELTARFLGQPTESQADAPVAPHEQPAGFATDARTAWGEATAVLAGLGAPDRMGKPPADWATYVRHSADADYHPMALGHFPQQVRDVSALLSGKPIERKSESHGWSASEPLLAAASARVERRFEEAARLLDTCEASETTLANERAALAWAQGDRAEAERIWNTMPASGAVYFNRGIAALATGRMTEAAAAFDSAAKLLPDASGWHHLANLYRALAR
jgi:tetratricopeptide (TPR) repeat protein